MKDLKNPETWRDACTIAMQLAYVHASLRAKPWSAKKLWRAVITRLDPVGPVRACNGHMHQLRTVYSGVYCGVKLGQDSRALYAAASAIPKA